MMRLASLAVIVMAATVAAVAPQSTARVSLAVQAVGDSVRVIATWTPRCDALGCPDRYRVEWTPRGAMAAPRTVAQPIDTTFVVAPALGDSVRVTVTVVALRRALSSPAITGSVMIRTRDAAPPPVDSLRVDTLDAMLDSFPVAVARDTAGNAVFALPVNGDALVCMLARNRYKGGVTIMVGPDDDGDTVAARCQRAAAQYASERSG